MRDFNYYFTAAVFCVCLSVSCSRTEKPKVADGQKAESPSPENFSNRPNLGWDLEITDKDGQTVRIKKADFGYDEEFITGKQHRRHGGVPLKIGAGTIIAKWEHIDKVEIAPYFKGQVIAGDGRDAAGDLIFPDDWKIVATLKSGKTQESTKDVSTDKLSGQTEIGDYSISMVYLRKIVVLGPST